jgi:hypothetical protein
MTAELVRREPPSGSGWLVWAGYAAAGCAALRLPLHLYYGLGGTAGLAAAEPSIEALPDGLSPTLAGLAWRFAHLGTAVLLVAVAVLAVALVRPWGLRLPSALLITPAFVVTVVALGYTASGLLTRVGAAAASATPRLLDGFTAVAATVGPSEPEQAALQYARWLDGGQPLSAYPMAALTAVEPWALALGLLLGLAAAYRLGGPAARRIWLVVVALGVLRLVA